MFDFSSQVVIVTGASGSLGQAVARCFRQAGARLVLVDLTLHGLHQAFPELDNHPEGIFCAADLTIRADVDEMAKQAQNAFGRIDVLVNVAGGFRMGTPVHETPEEMWDFMLDLNARSVFLSAHAVVPVMLGQGGGKIVNVAARAALAGKANMAAYVVSKSAVVRLTESMAAELRGQNINVNCILPGTIDTPVNRSDMPNADYSQWVSPEALADTILFLASDSARAVNGAALPVYGLS